MGAVASATGTGTTPTTSSTGTSKTLQASDFMNLLITQLKNQDPTQPMSNSDLLQQVSQIGNLQSQTQLQSTLGTLQTTMSGLVLQNQIGSAGNLIGKYVTGTDASSAPIQGIVTSVAVKNNTINLELDSGHELPLGNVTAIAPTNPTTTPSPATTSS